MEGCSPPSLPFSPARSWAESHWSLVICVAFFRQKRNQIDLDPPTTANMLATPFQISKNQPECWEGLLGLKIQGCGLRTSHVTCEGANQSSWERLTGSQGLRSLSVFVAKQLWLRLRAWVEKSTPYRRKPFLCYSMKWTAVRILGCGPSWQGLAQKSAGFRTRNRTFSAHI